MGTRLTEKIVKEFCRDADFETISKVNFKEPCEACITEQRFLICRRFREAELIGRLNYSSPENGPFFAVDAEWVVDWNMFANYAEEDNRAVSRYLYDQFKPPGRILHTKSKTVEPEVDHTNPVRLPFRACNAGFGRDIRM